MVRHRKPRQRGTSGAEYALGVGLVAVVAIVAAGNLGDDTGQLIRTVGSELTAATGIGSPDPFRFPDTPASGPGHEVESAPVVPPELYVTTAVRTSSGAAASVAGGPWTRNTAIAPGQSLRLRATAPDDFGGSDTHTVQVGAITASWTVTTDAPLESCAAIRNALPDAPTGVYTVDPDQEGPAPAVRTTCSMDWQGGGWTLVMNNVDNAARDMDLFASNIPNGGLDTTASGTVDLDHYLDGHRELIWGVGSNVILHLEENGSKAAPVAQPGRMCPPKNLRYDWTILAADPGWKNRHRNQYWRCSGYGADGRVAVNFTARGDDDGNYGPDFTFIGNGSSGFYNHRNRYDFDKLKYNGRANFKDSKPSFWTNSTTHQLWVR